MEEDLSRMQSQLAAWIQTKMPDAKSISISDLQKPGMGLSSETYLFDMHWDDSGQRKSKGVVLRSAPAEFKVFPDYELAHQFRIMEILRHTNVPVAKMLWLEADRLEDLGKVMTQEKLDRQRDVVRNERRQSYENAPYGKSELRIHELMYPKWHPYSQPVIGSHEDLAAATLEPEEWSLRPQGAHQIEQMLLIEGNVPIVDPNAPFRGMTFQPLAEGVAYGTLTFVPAAELDQVPLGRLVVVVTDQVSTAVILEVLEKLRER